MKIRYENSNAVNALLFDYYHSIYKEDNHIVITEYMSKNDKFNTNKKSWLQEAQQQKHLI